jgi:hypothetical protein
VRKGDETTTTMYGRLFKDEKWYIVSLFDGLQIYAEVIGKCDKVYRITGSYLPQRQTEIFTKG